LRSSGEVANAVETIRGLQRNAPQVLTEPEQGRKNWEAGSRN
jgi:hypothetical protein